MHGVGEMNGEKLVKQFEREVVAYKAGFADGYRSAKSEQILCEDCKHRDPEDKKCDCGHDIIWQLPRHDDWYCADAERRTE